MDNKYVIGRTENILQFRSILPFCFLAQTNSIIRRWGLTVISEAKLPLNQRIAVQTHFAFGFITSADLFSHQQLSQKSQ